MEILVTVNRWSLSCFFLSLFFLLFYQLVYRTLLRKKLSIFVSPQSFISFLDSFFRIFNFLLDLVLCFSACIKPFCPFYIWRSHLIILYLLSNYINLLLNTHLTFLWWFFWLWIFSFEFQRWQVTFFFNFLLRIFIKFITLFFLLLHVSGISFRLRLFYR